MQIQRWRWSSGEEAHRFVVSDPATGDPIAPVQGGGAAEIDGAVRCARGASDHNWRWRPARERGAMLIAVAKKLRAHVDEIAAIETRENGKALAQARLAVEAGIGSFACFGALAGKLPGDFLDAGPIYGATVQEPYGVVGAILSWAATQQGATIAAMAALLTDPALAGGFFVAPTLLTGITRDMAIARDEVSGPVLAVLTYDTFDEAVAIADDTPYGLTAAVFGGDQASGYGREHTAYTLKGYSRLKLVTLPSELQPIPAWSALGNVGL